MDSSLVTALANLGPLGLVILAVIFGFLVPGPSHRKVLEDSARKDRVIESLQEALALERQRSDAATQAGTVTNQLIGGLLQLATERRDQADGAAAGRAIPPAASRSTAGGAAAP